jgi:hypothetical protein
MEKEGVRHPVENFFIKLVFSLSTLIMLLSSSPVLLAIWATIGIVFIVAIDLIQWTIINPVLEIAAYFVISWAFIYYFIFSQFADKWLTPLTPEKK